MKLTTRGSFIAAVSLGAFAFIGGTGLTVSSAWLITMASEHPPILVLGVSIVMVRFFGIFRSVARYGERVISHEAIFRKLTGIRVHLFGVVATRIKEPIASFSKINKTLVDDVERAQEFYLRVTLPGLSATIAGLVTALIALWIDRLVFALIVPVALIFSLAIPLLVRRFLDPVAVKIELLENDFSEEISTSAHAMVEAEIFGYGEKYLQTLNSTAQDLARLEKINFRRTSLIQLLVVGSIGSTLVALITQLASKSDLLPIQVSMAIFLILVGFEGYTSWFPSLFPAGKNRRAATTVQSFESVGRAEIVAMSAPLNFDLEAREVIPFWRDKFLTPVDFSLPAGQTLVISGASGTGKSTLAAALFGFAEYSGSLTIGGVEISGIDQISDYVTGTLQNGYIFNTTLRENLKIAKPDASDAELAELITALELENIDLNEILGEFGRAISGGEAKRLSIARALLSSAPIVVLDEPLEHLDFERSQRIQVAIAQRTRGRTLIVITHSPWLQYSRKLELTRE